MWDVGCRSRSGWRHHGQKGLFIEGRIGLVDADAVVFLVLADVEAGDGLAVGGGEDGDVGGEDELAGALAVGAETGQEVALALVGILS